MTYTIYVRTSASGTRHKRIGQTETLFDAIELARKEWEELFASTSLIKHIDIRIERNLR